jgi:hypothetical protein
MVVACNRVLVGNSVHFALPWAPLLSGGPWLSCMLCRLRPGPRHSTAEQQLLRQWAGVQPSCQWDRHMPAMHAGHASVCWGVYTDPCGDQQVTLIGS